MDSPVPPPSPPEQHVLECLADLSYRTGELSHYLQAIAQGVSRLIASDWSIVTICEGEAGQVAASSLEMGEGDRGFSTHGTLVEEVVKTGRSRIIVDARREMPPNKPPAEYPCYLGVPLRIATGEVIGTICSFLRQPRSFTEADVLTVELFAERAATAIDNYRLYQQQQRFQETLEQEVAIRTQELHIAQAKLIEQERLAAIGEFTAMIIHEVRNPLTTIEMGLKYAQKVLTAATDQERLAISLSESHRLKHLLNEILRYAKPQVLQLSKLNLNQFLRQLLVQLQAMPEAAERSIVLIDTVVDVEIWADEDKLKQVFINLVRNAVEAIPPFDTVRCEIASGKTLDQVCITIHNGGDPIPPDILPQLTKPFCSTKPSGTGLGLAIVKRIITEHAGTLAIASSEEGTTVSLQIPIAHAALD